MNTLPATSPAATPDTARPAPLLEAHGLGKRFPVRGTRRWLHAVDDVSFAIERGECVGLVGESGCGKSTLVRLLTRLLDPTAGRILFEGRDIGAVPARQFAGAPERARIQMVFQDPADSLNPRFTALDTIAEPLRRLARLGGDAVRRRVDDVAGLVGLPRELLGALPAPALRRPAAARGHRAGHRRRAHAARARRADLGARRVGPGRHPPPPRRPPPPARDDVPVRLPRPEPGAAPERPRARDVPRPHRRGGARRRHLRPPAPSLHRALVSAIPVLDPGSRRRAHQARRRASQPYRPVARSSAASTAAAPTASTAASARCRSCAPWAPATPSPATFPTRRPRNRIPRRGPCLRPRRRSPRLSRMARRSKPAKVKAQARRPSARSQRQRTLSGSRSSSSAWHRRWTRRPPPATSCASSAARRRTSSRSSTRSCTSAVRLLGASSGTLSRSLATRSSSPRSRAPTTPGTPP